MEAEADLQEIEEADRVWKHVVDRLEELGFNPVQAISLADAGVDWHEARKLLGRGCSHDTAMSLLL